MIKFIVLEGGWAGVVFFWEGGGGLYPDVESCHTMYSQNITYINFKSLLFIHLETFKVINPVKFKNNSPPNVPNDTAFRKLD